LAAGAILGTAAPAQAGDLKAIWGPSELGVGNKQCPDPAVRCSAFPVYKKLGVDVFQFQIRWDRVAASRPSNPRDPSDPAYDWSATDEIVADADRHGIELAALVQHSPGWANGDREPIWAPTDPRDFADFVHAAAKRYESIRRWMIWGEVTRADNFMPMTEKGREGPRTYAQLLDRSYAALKDASRRNIVIGGMTLNSGTMKPARFIKLLKLKDGRPPRLDQWGHNPFEARFPDLSDDPIGPFRGLNDVDTLHREIEVRYRRGGRPVPKLWLSEWTLLTESRADIFNGFSVSRRQQAKRITAAYDLIAKTPYVAGLGWFTLLDQAESLGGAKWGLAEEDGTPKPGWKAFKKAG
jgi:hypothetical protein